MARSRIIRPEFWSDEKLSKLCLQARLLYIGLWSTSDDAGATQGHPLWLKSQIFPYDRISAKQLRRWLQELVSLGRIIPYAMKGEQYYFIPGFVKHQKVQHPSPAKNPPPPREVCEQCVRGSRADREDAEAETEAESRAKAETAPEASPGGRLGRVQPLVLEELKAPRTFTGPEPLSSIMEGHDVPLEHASQGDAGL